MTGRCEYIHPDGHSCSLQLNHDGLHAATKWHGVFIWHDDRCWSQNEFGTRCNLKRGHTGWHSGDNRYGNGVEGWK